MPTAIPRSKVKRNQTWNAESVFASPADFDSETKSILESLRSVKAFQGQLGKSPDSYYQRPGDFHWPTSNPLLETLWGIPWVFPLSFQLAPGESFTYTFTTTAKHRLHDGASPNEEEPGNRPYFWEAGTTTRSCTVIAES